MANQVKYFSAKMKDKLVARAEEILLGRVGLILAVVIIAGAIGYLTYHVIKYLGEWCK